MHTDGHRYGKAICVYLTGPACWLTQLFVAPGHADMALAGTKRYNSVVPATFYVSADRALERPGPVLEIRQIDGPRS
jgi:hypothetical protein